MTHRLFWKYPIGEPRAEQQHGVACSGRASSVAPWPSWHPWAHPVPQQGCHRRLVLVTGNVAPSAGCGENHTAALPSMSGSEITLPSAKETESSRDNQSTFPSFTQSRCTALCTQRECGVLGDICFPTPPDATCSCALDGHVCAAWHTFAQLCGEYSGNSQHTRSVLPGFSREELRQTSVPTSKEGTSLSKPCLIHSHLG